MENEKIGVLTYTVRHRKTYDLLCLLKAKGYQDVTVYASAFTYQKKHMPIIQHRPEIFSGMQKTREICENFQYRYIEGSRADFDIEQDRILLIAGAGILPMEFVKKHTIINSHPGYIPNCRGLDALKWAIVERQPIGVTTHYVGEFVDAGYVIERKRVPVYESDTFHAVARRVYEMELSMLAAAVKIRRICKPEYIAPGDYILHKRMPHTVEETLIENFEQYKELLQENTE